MQHKKKKISDKRMRAHREKTKNGSIRRRAYFAGWFVNFKFSQVASSGRAETVVAKSSEVCTVFVNQWTANGDKLDEKRYGQLWELSGQGERRCSELFVVCLRDTEGSQTGQKLR